MRFEVKKKNNKKEQAPKRIQNNNIENESTIENSYREREQRETEGERDRERERGSEPGTEIDTV